MSSTRLEVPGRTVPEAWHRIRRTSQPFGWMGPTILSHLKPYYTILSHIRRKFRSQTSDNMDRWKSRGGKSQRGEEKKWEDQRRHREKRKKRQAREKGRKVAIHCVFFEWFVALEGRKVGSLKRRVRSHLARWELKSCTPLWREAHVQVKMYKIHQVRTTCGSCNVEKVHAFVARSKFPSQRCKKLTVSDHFWKLRCGKSARHCSAKHISKSTCAKHSTLGPLLEVEMSKNSVRRCRTKTTTTLHHITLHFTTLHHTTLHHIPLHYTALHNTPLHSITLHSVSLHYIALPYATLHFATLYSTTLHLTTHYATLHSTTIHYSALRYTTLHYATLDYTTLHYTTPYYTTLNYITLRYATLNCITLHYTTPSTLSTLHYAMLHYSPVRYTPLHYTTLHSTTLRYTLLHYTPLHYATLHYTQLLYTTVHSTTLTTLHYTTLHYTTLRYTTLHYTTLHYTTLHYTTLHYTTLHPTTLHSTTLLWREAHFQVKMLKARHVWTTFWRSDVEKIHAIVARSTFGSQEHENCGFWAFFDRCRKIAH